MNIKKMFIFVFIICFLFVGPVYSENENTIAKLPSIFVPQNLYNFKAVVDGTEVKHGFLIQNKGTAPLLIQKVKAG